MNFGKFGFWSSILAALCVIIAISFRMEYLIYPAILFIIVSIIFGIISYFRKKQNNLESTTLSTIGVILSVLVGLFLFVAVTSCIGCGPPMQPQPNDTAINLLNNCSQSPYKLYVNTIRFSEKYPLISKKRLMDSLDVGENLFLYISKDLTNFSLDNNTIKYLGKSTLNVIATAECGEDKNEILLGLNRYIGALDGKNGEFNCHLVISPQN
jgi:hypothetical protein